MYQRIIFFFSILLLFYSCSNDRDAFVRDVKEINKEVFYGIDSSKKKQNDNLITLMVNDVNKAFSIGSINESLAENEVRIYYSFPFGETFFRQQFKDGRTNLELYICNTERRQDSLFMKIKTVVKSEGKYPYDSSLNVNFTPDSLTINNNYKEEDVLDGFATFVIQIKNHSQSKFILIERPFDVEDKNAVAKYVCNLIREINKKFSFKFHDPQRKIVDSAFINPYNLINTKATQ
jgi:hypothetical protein